MKLFCKDNCIEAGIDEAGRGCLIGRVYAAAVIWPQENDEDYEHPIMKDSKKFSREARERMYDYVKENAIDYAFILHEQEEENDRRNAFILHEQEEEEDRRNTFILHEQEEEDRRNSLQEENLRKELIQNEEEEHKIYSENLHNEKKKLDGILVEEEIKLQKKYQGSEEGDSETRESFRKDYKSLQNKYDKSLKELYKKYNKKIPNIQYLFDTKTKTIKKKWKKNFTRKLR